MMSLSEAREILKGAKNVIDLGFGEIDFITPKNIRAAAIKALEEGFTHYAMPVEGILELREAIADNLYRENGIKVDPVSEVLVTEGASTAIYVVLLSLLSPKDEVIMTDPCFSVYPQGVKAAGGVPVQLQVKEERGFRIDPEDIEKSITPKTKMIVLVSPDNPTGSALERDDLEAVAEMAVKHNLLVISDEIYEKLTFGGRKHYSIASLEGMKERTITINGFSKAYAMTGLRVGYVATDETLMKKISPLHVQIVTCTNAIGQKAAVEALRGPQNEMKAIWREYEERSNMLADGLNDMPGITCIRPGGSIYVYPNIKSFKMTSGEFSVHIAREANVLVYPATVFGKGGEGYLRVVITTNRDGIYDPKASKGNIVEALERIEKAVKKLKK